MNMSGVTDTTDEEHQCNAATAELMTHPAADQTICARPGEDLTGVIAVGIGPLGIALVPALSVFVTHRVVCIGGLFSIRLTSGA